ncbi:MAG TPA: RHS repeat-associated core domain-containing protein [Longimicrobium sp.]|nr:RHS repeat-associated core domain-containing protein [Longimicrobium sp.]
MNRTAPPPLRTAWLLLLLLCGLAAPALAQTPTITFVPLGRTFHGANQQIQVHLCDDSSIRDASTRVWLNGTLLTTPSWSQGDGSCAVHHVLAVNVTLASGSNTLQVKACENIAPESCVTESETYSYTTPDAVKPTAFVSPSGGTYTSPAALVTIGWCDDYKLNTTSTQAWLNGTALSLGTPTADASTSGCYSAYATPVMLNLQPGVDSLKAVVRDSAGNVSDTLRATFTYAPVVSKVGEDRVRRPGLCAVRCFDATLSYAGPTYTSMDAQHGFVLTYSSAHAQPRGLVQVDVAIGSGAAPSRISLQLKNSSGAYMPLFGRSTQTQVWYAGATGTNRVSAWFDASSLPTGTYRYTAEVTRDYGGGTTPQTDTVGVRVIVINESASRYGAGWSLAGEAKLILPSGSMDPSGVTLVDGTGNAVFFATGAGCGSTGNCTYASPPSEFKTLVRTGDRFALLSPQGDSTVFTLQGRVVRVVDRFNNITTFNYYDSACSYCSVGKLGSIQDPAGKYLSIQYLDSSGNAYVLHRVAWGGYPYVVLDGNGDLSTIYDVDGTVALTATYSGHRLTGYTDRAGNHTDLQYDSAGKMSTVIGPAYRAQGSSGWRDTTRVVSYERAVLPGAGLGTSTTTPAAAVSPLSAYAWLIGVRNDTTRLHLDGWRAADQVRDRLGYLTGSARNADGLTTLVTDAKGNSTTWSWNGRLLAQVTDPNGTVQYDYDSSGRLTREYGNTAETRYFYSAGAAWVMDSVHVDGQGTVRLTHDTRGRMLSQGDSAAHTTTIQYDTTTGGWMNIWRVSEPGSRTTTYGSWDSYGRVTQVTTLAGTTTTAYDALGRVSTSTAPDLGVTRYYYGTVQLDSVKDARNQVFKWTRNELGWVESETRPDTTLQRTATYDRFGHVVSATDRRGSSSTVTFQYDALDRVTTLVAGGDTTMWSYSPDQPGVTSAPTWLYVKNPYSADSLHYDGLGRLARTVTLRTIAGVAQKYEVAYTYNAQGGVDTLKYRVNGGAWAVSRYVQSNSTGLLTSVRDFSGRNTTLAYNGEGGLTQVTYGNGQVGSLSYTSTHQLSRIGYSGTGLNIAAGIRLMYDGADRLIQQSNDGLTRYRDFAYDGNDRLTTYADRTRSTSHTGCTLEVDVGWVCPDDSQWSSTTTYSFTYDLTDNPTDRSALVALGNKLRGYDGWTLTYDAEGNVIGKSKTGSPSYTFNWNAQGQLASVDKNGVLAAYYKYDGLGRRVLRDGATTGVSHFVYTGDNLLLAVNNSGTITDEYTYFPGVDQPLGVRRGTAQHYFAIDANGNVLAITDSVGTVKNSYGYSPWGVNESPSETFFNPLRYAAREWDPDAGIYFNRARWYDPDVHRFISQDPIGVGGGLNLYAYAGNDPVNGNDPTGLFGCKYTGHRYDRQTQAYTNGWTCDSWGAPLWYLTEVMALRRFAARQCDPWACDDGLIQIENPFAGTLTRENAARVLKAVRPVLDWAERTIDCADANRLSNLPIFQKNESVHRVARTVEDVLDVNFGLDLTATLLKGGGRLGTPIPWGGGASMVIRRVGRTIGQSLGMAVDGVPTVGSRLTGVFRVTGKAVSEALLIPSAFVGTYNAVVRAQCAVGLL